MREWTLTNGIGQIPVCDVCAQPIYEGHVDCTCDKNHPENCTRPTYAQLQEHLRKITVDNMILNALKEAK